MKKVLAGGRFNILHPGHIYFLQKAKSLGDYLVVVLAHDKTILKQKKALLFPAEERKMLIESLKCVDKVIIGYEIGDESGYIRVVNDESPDIIALGYDQKINAKVLQGKIGKKIKIVRIGNYKGYATQKIIKRK